jgi:ATP-binding protein involved in chromosome partitioning
MSSALTPYQTALQAVRDPLTGVDLFAQKSVQVILDSADHLHLDVRLPYPARSLHAALQSELATHLAPCLGGRQLTVTVGSDIVAHTVQRGLTPLPQVRNIIAIASGKGGVGKSTTTVNLALALASEGARVGILDADIYGPSQPLLLGLQGQQPESPDGKSMLPLIGHGVQVMSIGFLIDASQPMVWRGPMVTQALMQLLNDTRWDNLDYLLVDLPPGTGDIQLTLSQKVPLTGAVIVTTPQDIALLDARKGLNMFAKVGVPIIGIVENMSMHICSQCGHMEPIFGSGGGASMSAEHQVDLLGQLPLDLGIRLNADAGTPIVMAQPDSAVTASYQAIARQMAVRVAQYARDFSSKMPKIVIQPG